MTATLKAQSFHNKVYQLRLLRYLIQANIKLQACEQLDPPPEHLSYTTPYERLEHSRMELISQIQELLELPECPEAVKVMAYFNPVFGEYAAVAA
jgi:hypothetical protein